MERLKKSRRPVRATLTRLQNEVDTIIEGEVIDKNILRAKLQMMQQSMENLEELDNRILNHMIDSSIGSEEQQQKEQDTESTAAMQYKETFLLYKIKIESYLAEGTKRSLEDDTESVILRKRNFKLPKIELRKFNGDLKQWLGWWSQFSKIHDDEEIDACDKIQYLSQAMEPGSEPKELVDSYPQTDDNYPKVVSALKERFGRHDLLLQVPDKIPLTSLYLKLESHLRSLSALSLTQADPATWLFPLVESSLSEDTLRAWQRSTHSKEDGSKLIPPKTRLDFLMEFIKLEVQSEQQISLAPSGFQSTAQKKKTVKSFVKKGEEIPTAAGLLATQVATCVFCEGHHDSDRCVKAMSMPLEDRKNRIREKQACYQCLKRGHTSKKCKAVVKCIVCSGRHYPILCYKISGDQLAGNIPISEGDTQKEHQLDATSTGMYSNQCSSEVLLNTLMVKVIGETSSIIVRMVGDTGSQRSYIRESVVRDAHCKKVGDEWLQNIIFGGEATPAQRVSRYAVKLGSVHQNTHGTFELLEKQRICGKLPKVPTGVWIAELAQKGIQLSDHGSG